MKFMRRAIAVILIAAFVLLCVGCGKSYRDAIVYFELIEQPETLDAQTAYSDSELLIVRNIYEGLLREDENGKIVKGACENYEKQGLTYIFKLRDKLSWSNGKALTAQDFVYGFRRAVAGHVFEFAKGSSERKLLLLRSVKCNGVLFHNILRSSLVFYYPKFVRDAKRLIYSIELSIAQPQLKVNLKYIILRKIPPYYL